MLYQSVFTSSNANGKQNFSPLGKHNLVRWSHFRAFRHLVIGSWKWAYQMYMHANDGWHERLISAPKMDWVSLKIHLCFNSTCFSILPSSNHSHILSIILLSHLSNISVNLCYEYVTFLKLRELHCDLIVIWFLSVFTLQGVCFLPKMGKMWLKMK